MFRKIINLGFWEKLHKPVMVIAPMADVTDVAFRQMFAKYGKPDVMWTEFVSCDGLIKAPKDKQDILWADLKYFENERPIVAQIFSSQPKMMEEAAYQVAKAGFDGIDINMGCPDRAIQKQESGAALIKNPKRAVQMIKAAKKGIKRACKEINSASAKSYGVTRKELIPLSVKTRLGYNQDVMEDWISVLLKQKLALITIHARTKKEMSKVPAKWNRIKDAVKLRDKISPQTLIFGNGDVKNLDEAKKRVEETGCDGVMIGRGIFGNPYLFSQKSTVKSQKEKLELLLEHSILFEKYLPHKNFNIMKKHFKAYVNGFDGAKELREKLMECKNSKEVEFVIKKFYN